MKKLMIAAALCLVLVAIMVTPAMAGHPNKIEYNPELEVISGSATISGDLETGFTIVVSGTPGGTNVIDLDNADSTPQLKNGMYGFTLKANAAQKNILYDYFAAKPWPDDWYPQINKEIVGATPYFFLKAEDGEYSLVDNFKLTELEYEPSAAVLTIDDDYPEGTYVYMGQLKGENNKPLNLKIILNVVWEETAALAYVQDNTVLSSVSGTIADLKATFPASIPPWFDTAGYVIDTRVTLSEPLPEGSEVTLTRVGMYTDVPLSLDGTGPFWLTELLSAARYPFTNGYNGAVEDYVITVTSANPGTTVLIESVISKDGYMTETVLDAITLDVVPTP